MWLPLEKQEGTFAATSIYIDASDPELPHIGYGGGCMGLASGPKTLTRTRDFKDLEEALAFCHSRVQLDSLYTNVGSMVKNWGAAMPTELKAVLSGGGAISSAITLARRSNEATVVNRTQEENSTWTA